MNNCRLHTLVFDEISWWDQKDIERTGFLNRTPEMIEKKYRYWIENCPCLLFSFKNKIKKIVIPKHLIYVKNTKTKLFKNNILILVNMYKKIYMYQKQIYMY